VALDGFHMSTFSAPMEGGHVVTHDVYERGEGPPVVIIQELPGIGPQTLQLADHFVDQGFRAVLPHLFGPLGKVSMLGNMVRVFCMRREFQLFEKNHRSAVVDWLKALCRDVRDRHDAPGVGVIGMCLTGNFAISLMADDSVLAAMASQPSMPLFGSQRALHMDDEEISAVRTRLDSTGPMYAYRFEGDSFCQAEKFQALDETFNSDAERIRLVTLPGKGHSVLTLDFVNEHGHPTREALDTVTGYFTEKLTS
jgi:dienelactone hydrolase